MDYVNLIEPFRLKSSLTFRSIAIDLRLNTGDIQQFLINMQAVVHGRFTARN